MNTQALARSAYGDARAPIRTDRSVEYQAFAKVTAALKEAKSEGRTDHVRWVEALHLNRSLWSILGDDVSDDANQLPMELRQQIFALSRFVNKQTSKVVEGTAEIEPLIEINTSIMRGLRGEVGG